MTALAQLRQRLTPGPRSEGRRRAPAGWLVVANKEFGDHVTSIRFTVLLLILAVAVAAPLYFASGTIRAAAPQISGVPSIFLFLFTLGPQDPNLPSILRFDFFVALLAPLLGIAFGFDAVNVERSEGTLPRLVAQPIHRDDVINGKFAAGLATIALMLAALFLLVAGFGIFRLGIVPSLPEVIRVFAWYLVTVLYVGFWLAFAMLLSVAVRRAAASALIAFGVWFFFLLFWSLVASLGSTLLSPAGTTGETTLANAQTYQTINRLSPGTLYGQASVVLIDPRASSTDVSVPGSLAAVTQAQQQIPSLSCITTSSGDLCSPPEALDASLLLVWPQVVALVALTVVAFGASYILFMRQEVRA